MINYTLIFQLQQIVAYANRERIRPPRATSVASSIMSEATDRGQESRGGHGSSMPPPAAPPKAVGGPGKEKSAEKEPVTEERQSRTKEKSPASMRSPPPSLPPATGEPQPGPSGIQDKRPRKPGPRSKTRSRSRSGTRETSPLNIQVSATEIIAEKKVNNA